MAGYTSAYTGMMLWKLIYFAVGSFIFSWIFWKTHQLMHKKK